jgi:ribosome-associated toxin RatA of RatAB toxin-antitoxin module
MAQYSTSITINASQEAVWKVLSDVARWHEWTPTVTKVEVIDQSELKLNHRYKVYQPKLQPVVWTVTMLEAPSIFIWEARIPGMTMIAEHETRKVDPNQTELLLKFSFHGFLGEIMGRLTRKTAEEYIRTEAESLRKRVEGK